MRYKAITLVETFYFENESKIQGTKGSKNTHFKPDYKMVDLLSAKG